MQVRRKCPGHILSMHSTDPFHSVSLSGILLGLGSQLGLDLEYTPSQNSMRTSITKTNLISEFSSVVFGQPHYFFCNGPKTWQQRFSIHYYLIFLTTLGRDFDDMKGGASCLFGRQTASKVHSTTAGLQPKIINCLLMYTNGKGRGKWMIDRLIC